MAVIPFLIDFVDNLALLDIPYFGAILGIADLIILCDRNPISRIQRGGIAVIAAVCACLNLGIAHLHLTIDNIVLKCIGEGSGYAVFGQCSCVSA